MAWLSGKAMILLIVLAFVNPLHARTYKDFPQVSAKVGTHKLPKLYLAIDNEDRSLGLMNVSEIDADTGVLFVFEEPQTLSFWMKNTFVPLSIGFFDSRGCLLEVQDMEPVKSVLQTQIPQYRSRHPAQFALEVQKGWFRKNKVTEGMGLQILGLPSPRASLSPNSLNSLKQLLNPRKCPAGKGSSGS